MNLHALEKEVPFDQFSRQYQVQAILNKIRSKGETFKILDVGGYKGRTADFLPEDEVTILDLYDIKDANYVQGSALEMPFEENSFDYVVSFDVLEHIPADKRQLFFDECNRTAKKGVIICAPHKSPANEYAETSLNNLYKKLHRKPHQWLREHIEYGIPDFGMLTKYADRKGLFTTCLTSNKTQLWVAMQQAIFLHSKYPMATEELLQTNEFYNQNFTFDGGGSMDSAYRLILVCLVRKQDVEVIKEHQEFANKPIDPLREIQLFERINEFTRTLVNKEHALTQNYQSLYEHERSRVEALQQSNDALTKRLESLPNRVLRKARTHIHKKA